MFPGKIRPNVKKKRMVSRVPESSRQESDFNRRSTSSGLIKSTVKLSVPSAPNTQLCYMARWIFHKNISFHIASNIHTATNTVIITLIVETKGHKWIAFDNTCYVLLLLQEVRISNVMQGDLSLDVSLTIHRELTIY